MTNRVAFETESERSAPASIAGSKAAQPLTDVQDHYRRVVLEKLSDGRFHTEEVALCVCGSSEATEVIRGDRFGLPVVIVMCNACGLLRTSPRLAAENLPDFYDQDYHGLHIGTPEATPNQSLYQTGQGREIFSFLRSHLRGKNLKCVEVGAATGSVLRELAEAAQKENISTSLLGCEYSASYCLEGARMGTEIRQGGIETLADVADADVIILSHVMEHFADLPAELARLRKMSTSATLVYVEVPGVLDIHNRPEYDFELERYFTLAHTYHFTLTTLTRVMAQAGFTRLAGTEKVRSVFKLASPDAPVDMPQGARDQTLQYLSWLKSSRGLSARRYKLRAERWARRTSGRLIRQVAGESGMSVARQLRRSLTGAR